MIGPANDPILLFSCCIAILDGVCIINGCDGGALICGINSVSICFYTSRI